jgi:REP element-mobilizing transposase RayT
VVWERELLLNHHNHHRKSLRLKGYDYSKPGFYFVTICCQDQQYYFGRIENQEMKLSTIGQITKQCWENIPGYFENTQLDEFVIMPNHIHGIIQIVSDVNRMDLVHGRGLINQTPTIGHAPPTIGHDPPTIDPTNPTVDHDTPNKSPVTPTNKNYRSIESHTKNKKSSNDTNWILMKNPNITLGKIIRYFKAKSTKMIRKSGYKNFRWQRNYYDPIIRDKKELRGIRKYIIENLLKWVEENNNLEINT